MLSLPEAKEEARCIRSVVLANGGTSSDVHKALKRYWADYDGPQDEPTVPTEERKLASRRTYLKSKYSMTLEDYDRMMLAQQSTCPMCDVAFSDSEPPYIDHCHASGRVRGLLCRSCNFLLGLYERDSGRLLRSANNAEAYLTD